MASTPLLLGAAALLVGAAPPLHLSGDLEPHERVQAEVAATWSRCEAHFLERTLVRPAASSSPLRVRRAPLPLGHAGASRPGEIRLRQAQPFALSPAELQALRHETAHQFLFVACPTATGDELFHEAFAMAASGELGLWQEGPDYLSLAAAQRALAESRAALGSSQGRRALARLLAESHTDNEALPWALWAPLRRCADGSPWRPLSPAELAAGAPRHVAAPFEAAVVLHRASGEAIYRSGEFDRPVPFGSTLKPFVMAGATSAPLELEPRRTAEWACGARLPARVGAHLALIRSCNGYFLDWGARRPELAQLGVWGPVLQAAGLARLPADMPEALGLRASSSLSALGLARAYRLLALARPDLLEVLRAVPRDGTLSGLEISRALDALALKTGTVRDADSRPRFGWIVGVSDTVVAVMVRGGAPPRAFAQDFWRLVARTALPRADGATTVQVLGLLDAATVRARCGEGAFAVARDRAGRGEPRPLGRGPFDLLRAVRAGEVLCLGEAFGVDFPGVRPPEGRAYAGLFRFSEPPPYRPEAGRDVSARAARARAGSPLLFTTSRGLYAAGVLRAEDASIEGEARAALLRVVDANGQVPRHGGRPVCDTTHCQVFLGTARPSPADVQALARPLSAGRWLHFSRGGDEPWREERPLERVERAVGGPFAALAARGERVEVTTRSSRGEAVWDETVVLGCELLRGPLRLPSCPVRIEQRGAVVRFEGVGMGHGLGLDVERAKAASGATSDELLVRAYGDALVEGGRP